MSELPETQAYYSSASDTPPLMLYVCDETGHTVFLNQALLQFLGTNTQDMLGAGWVNIMHAEDRQVVLAHAITAVYARQPYTMKYRIKCQRKPVAWVQDLGLPLHDVTGKYYGYLGLIFDLSTHEPQATTCLLGECTHAVILHRPDGTITYWGEAAAALYGWAADEARGRKLDELICCDALSQLAQMRVALRQQEDWSGLSTHTTKDRRTLSVQVRSTYLNHSPHVPLAARDLVTVICF